MPQGSSNPPAAGGQRSAFRMRVTLPAIFVLVAAGVIVYAMARNQDVAGVKVSDDGVEVAFASSSSLSSTDIAAKQNALEKSVQSLEARAQQEGAREGNETVVGARPNLTGDWRGSNGLGYRIDQYGARAVISEMSPWGISAAGEG